MKIGIITPMAEEKGAIVAALSNVQHEVHGGSDVTIGEYNGHQVMLTESGIGKVAAGMATALLIARFAPDLVVNTGSAGALHPELEIGDTVIGTRVAYHDVDVTVFGYDKGQLPGQPLYFEANPEVVADFEKLAAVKEGLIVAGDQFVQDKQRVQILQDFPDALAVEMESPAVAQVATKMGVPFIVFRAISDKANEESGVIFDDFVVEAGKQSAKLLLAYLDQKA
jgi:adenosylhomocysteine nucleosidase